MSLDDELITKIDHYRWLIDRASGHLLSFQTRVFEILALNAIIISIIWSKQTDLYSLNLIDRFILLYYLILFFIQIICLIAVAIPRKSPQQLTLEASLRAIMENEVKYYGHLRHFVDKRAKITRFIFKLFNVQMILISFLLLFFVFNISAQYKFLIVLIIIFLTFPIIIGKEKFLIPLIEKVIDGYQEQN